ncbi:MAG: hypothetical protein HQ517_13700 [SAR324 cluster bacterium]|nr:hypothetical protein [SAR324 cluster bacterium]
MSDLSERKEERVFDDITLYFKVIEELHASLSERLCHKNIKFATILANLPRFSRNCHEWHESERFVICSIADRR